MNFCSNICQPLKPLMHSYELTLRTNYDFGKEYEQATFVLDIYIFTSQLYAIACRCEYKLLRLYLSLRSFNWKKYEESVNSFHTNCQIPCAHFMNGRRNCRLNIYDLGLPSLISCPSSSVQIIEHICHGLEQYTTYSSFISILVSFFLKKHSHLLH